MIHALAQVPIWLVMHIHIWYQNKLLDMNIGVIFPEFMESALQSYLDRFTCERVKCLHTCVLHSQMPRCLSLNNLKILYQN